RRAERVVHGERGGVVPAVRVRRIERCDRRHAGVGRQVGADAHLGGGARRGVAGGQLQVGQAAGVEAGPAGVGREYLQPVPGRVDHEAVVVRAEVAGARVHRGAAVGEGEEAFAADRQVQRAAGELDVALAELLRHGRQLHAGADRVPGQDVSGDREQVGELGARLLEAGGGGVGDVVRGDVEVLGGGVHATAGDVEAHVVLLCCCGAASADAADRGKGVAAEA